MTVPAALEEAATAVLWEHGTTGIQVLAPATLLAYFPEAAGLHARLAAALAPLPGARVEPAEVPDVDWVARYREEFRSFSVAGFRVVPPWELHSSTPHPVPPHVGGGDGQLRSSTPHPSLGPSSPHVGGGEGPQTAAPYATSGDLLVVDPGRAFGTGTHESTRLCLGFLRELASRGPLGRVLDLGTGSGILAVAAVRLGARAVTAVDLDPEALVTARHQAGLNHVELRLMRGDLATAVRPGRFDLVLANIAAPLLVDRCDEIAALRAPAIVLSGLLTADLDAVRRSYAGFGRLDARTDGEWAAVLVDS